MSSTARMEVSPQIVEDQAPRNVDFLLRLIAHLSEVQHYVLGRVAVHCWRFNGEIPYFPSNAHQAQAAWSLAHSDVRLLSVNDQQRRMSYTLTRRGERVVHRLFEVVPARLDQLAETEFTELRRFMRNKPELTDED